jgi:microcystin-dependent protein
VTYEHGVGEFLVHSLASLDCYVPIGSGFDFWGTTAPSSAFAFPYGQAVSRTTYATLFSRLGTQYGTGDGSTTFNLPDKRGRVSAGKDDMGGSSANRLTNQSGGLNGDTLGGTGGSETHQLTSAQMPSHTHTATDAGHAHVATSGTAFVGTATAVAADGSIIGVPSAPTALSGLTTGTSSASIGVSSTGGDSAHNNVQPTIICNYMIRIL